MMYLKKIGFIYLLALGAIFNPLSLIGQIDVVSGDSSSECYVEASSNVTYTFNLQFTGVDANSVTLSTTAVGISFSNPVGGNNVGAQTVDYNGSYAQNMLHAFVVDLSAINNVGVVNITATVSGVDGSSDTYNFALSFVSANPVSSVTCNSLVNITLDNDCQNIIHPDQILEGGNYACWDLYTVNVVDQNGNDLGNMVDHNHIGQTLNVQVIGPNNNICWGQIAVDDKFGPVFQCQDVVTSCVADISPGASLSSEIYVNIPLSADISSLQIQMGATPVSNLVGSLISAEGIHVSLDITHPDLSELTINLISPQGTSVPFTDFAGQNFTDFTGENPNGTWNVMIIDNQGNGSTDLTVGTLNEVSFLINQVGGAIPFPIPAGLTATFIGNDTYTVPAGLDACSETTIQFTDSVQSPGCSSDYEQIITRTWTGVDESGNVGGCEQTIFIYRTGLEDIVWPVNLDNISAPALSCAVYGETIPPVSVTGVPSGYLCSNIEFLDPEDAVFDKCEKSYKLIRTWTAIDWCSGNDLEYEQTILVENDTNPIINCPATQSISTHPYSCNAEYNVVAPSLSFTCSEIFTWTVAQSPNMSGPFSVIGVSGNMNSGFTISDLPLGRTWVRYQVVDDCGNRAECVSAVDVSDQIEPFPVCDEFTVVSIQGLGSSLALAESFDDGSSDNCGISHFEVRKLVDICSNNTSFGPSVRFCCDEVNTSVQVELRVWDISNNSSTCIVEVSVQDLLPPHFTFCPDDITIACGSDAFLDDDFTGIPIGIDNCSTLPLEAPELNIDLDNCGEGIVTKTWTVFDEQGFKDVCVQNIFVQNNSPFMDNDIVWPFDYDVTGCNPNGLEPDNLPDTFDEPDLSASDVCDMVASTHIDQVFPFGNGGIKILRKWSVIDWCQYDQSTGVGFWEWEQIIKCTDASGAILAARGVIKTEYNDPVNNAMVTMDSDADGFPQTIVNEASNGSYEFTDLIQNESYSISVEKSDDPLNGVSTLDMALIQRHLLRIAEHDSPYKIIASDIDGNGIVSAIDLIHLRKMILGIFVEFPNDQKEWRFVKEDQVIPDPTDPFPFIEVINIFGIDQAYNQEDFVAVKIGDVNGDVDPINARNTSDTRSSETTSLTVQSYEQGNEYVTEFSSIEIKHIVGFQMSIGLENEEIEEIIPHVDGMTLENFAMHNDYLAVSWHGLEDYEVDGPLFSVVTRNEVELSLTDNIVPELYNENLDILSIELETRRDEVNTTMQLHQNSPNPFASSTQISFEIGEAMELNLGIYDLQGRLLMSKNIEGTKGYNELTISARDLPTGVLYYQLDSKLGSQIMKMIVVE